VAGIHEIFFGHAPVPRYIDHPVHGGVEERGHGVGGSLRERHVGREHAGQVRYVSRVVRVALPLRHPRVGRERQQLDQRRTVLVAYGSKTLVVEVLEQHQVE